MGTSSTHWQPMSCSIFCSCDLLGVCFQLVFVAVVVVAVVAVIVINVLVVVDVVVVSTAATATIRRRAKTT